MQIIGYHITVNLAVNSLGESAVDNFLDFLLDYKPGTIKVFYHLDYSVTNLFRNLGIGITDLRKLSNGNELYLAPYKFNYMPKKYFNLQYGGGRGAVFCNFNDMYQFHRISDLTEHDPYHYANEAARIGQEVYAALVKIGLAPNSLTSPVRCWEKEVLAEMDLPGINDLPEPAAKMAYDCCEGGWIEAFQKGHFEQTWDYDMRSAYGSFTRELLDTRYGTWQEAPYYDPAAYYAYALCEVEVTAALSPITYKHNDEKITPRGKLPRPRILSKRYLDFIAKYKIANINILNAWLWFPDKLVTPLETMIDELYQFKLQARPGIEEGVIKRILAGTWGKFLQVNNNQFGDLFNPVWAEEVESACRLSTAAFIYDNHLENNVLSVAVDGVLSSRPVSIQDDGKIGQWKLSNQGAAYVISSGICAVQGKDQVLDSDKEDKDSSGDFTLKYDWLYNQVKANPQAREYSMQKYSPVTIQKAVTQRKMEVIGQHEVIEKTIDLSFESKRYYPKMPLTGFQLHSRQYQSQPIDIESLILLEV